jgi:hypothetical protein
LRIGSEDCVDEPSEAAHRPQLALRELMRAEVEIQVRVSRMIPLASRPAD